MEFQARRESKKKPFCNSRCAFIGCTNIKIRALFVKKAFTTISIVCSLSVSQAHQLESLFDGAKNAA